MLTIWTDLIGPFVFNSQTNFGFISWITYLIIYMCNWRKVEKIHCRHFQQKWQPLRRNPLFSHLKLSFYSRFKCLFRKSSILSIQMCNDRIQFKHGGKFTGVLLIQFCKLKCKQECIPVGCVPSAAVAVPLGGGSARERWCLSTGGCLPGRGSVCLLGRGVCPGGCLPARGVSVHRRGVCP